MNSRRKVSVLVAALALVMLFTACPSRTNIGRLLSDPDRYRDKEVGIGGRVTDSYGVPLVGGAYKLDDGSGEIWIISRGGGVPSRGAQVGVRGRVYTGFNFAGRNFGTVVEEAERRRK